MSNEYRKELPPIPVRMRGLPITRGYPTPWFVAQVNGEYDFRVMDERKLIRAVKEKRCWVCGEPLGVNLAFTIGPMCAVNRTSAEPPEHFECATFSAKACPFLTQREPDRREFKELPTDVTEPAGCMIKRQPGVVLVWVTNNYRILRTERGPLFRIGEAKRVFWWREGRAATRAEILESIESGLPLLRQPAEEQSAEAVAQLEKQIQEAMVLLPAA